MTRHEDGRDRSFQGAGGSARDSPGRNGTEHLPVEVHTGCVDGLVEDLFRRQAAQIISTLTRILGPRYLELVEDAFQEAMISALRQWTFRGVPANPAGWLLSVARNFARDALRRERVLMSKQDQLGVDSRGIEDELANVDDLLNHQLRDDQLRMMFMCCDPSVPRESRVALTLKTLGGLGVPEIARAFLVNDGAIAQRLVRAKRCLRLRAAGLGELDSLQLTERLDSVLDVLYLIFNEGYSAHRGASLVRRELCSEGVRLTTLLTEHPIGDIPKVHALLALMLLQASRLPARTDDRGDIMLLEDQDRNRWDRSMIVAGLRELARAATGDELGEYHLQAGIAACHAVAPDFRATDWRSILQHYDDLLLIRYSPVVALNRAVAVAMLEGARAGILELDHSGVSRELNNYPLLHATLGSLRQRSGNLDAARFHFTNAVELTESEPERRFLQRRLLECSSLCPTGVQPVAD